MAKTPTGRGRGRPPRNNPPEPATARKNNGPSIEVRAEFLADLIKLKTEASRVAGEVAALHNRFKGLGGDPKQLKGLYTLSRMDSSEAAMFLRTQNEYAAGIGIKVVFGDDGQGSVIEELSQEQRNTQGQRDLERARAHADGFNSGKNKGTFGDNPHNAGTDQHVAWREGCEDGIAARAGAKPKEAGRVKAAKKADATLPSDAEAKVAEGPGLGVDLEHVGPGLGVH